MLGNSFLICTVPSYYQNCFLWRWYILLLLLSKRYKIPIFSLGLQANKFIWHCFTNTKQKPQDSWIRDKGLYYSWQSSSHNFLLVCFGSPCPSKSHRNNTSGPSGCHKQRATFQERNTELGEFITFIVVNLFSVWRKYITSSLKVVDRKHKTEEWPGAKCSQGLAFSLIPSQKGHQSSWPMADGSKAIFMF